MNYFIGWIILLVLLLKSIKNEKHQSQSLNIIWFKKLNFIKKQIYFISFALLSSYGKAQNAGVEKKITGAQIGLFGLDF